MRLFLAVVLAAGCGSHAATGPAWPKQHEAEKDGGESLAPHTVRGAVAAVEKSGDDDQPAKPVVATPAATPAKDGAVAPTAPTATPAAEEPPITTEDIIIEIDD